MDQQSSSQNSEPAAKNNAPTSVDFSNLKKDLIISACVGLLCAVLILPIAKNLDIGRSWALSLFVILPVLSVVGMQVAYWLSQKIAVFYQLAKFILVGAFNTFFDWGILNLLMFLTGTSVGYLYSVFKGISFLAAMTSSYFWNKFWTFKKAPASEAAIDRPRKSAKEVLQFFIVSVIGFSINVGVATLLVNVWGPQFGLSRELWANVGAFGGTVLGMSWNFLGYKLIVFKS